MAVLLTKSKDRAGRPPTGAVVFADLSHEVQRFGELVFLKIHNR
jgi:hypothetical protein